MASDAHVVLVGPAAGAAQYARRRLEELERLWSRFRPSSDVSRLNETPEAFIVVSPDTLELLATMKQAWNLTGGRYDPTLLAAINAAGYSRSHDGSGRRSSSAGPAASACTIADVALHPASSAVVVPAGLGIDPGGIGKGLAADVVVTELLDRGTAGALVGVGGDLAAAGRTPEADGWQVAVEHPFDVSRELVRVRLGAGGVATSSTLTRAWVRDGDRCHHVIDPGTGESATTDLAAVTVFARAGWEAEVHATAALLSGAARALAYLERHDLDGIVTTLGGTTTSTPALRCAGETEWSAA